ncbi:MAG: metal ABC transporter ATP-binding protein [Candidatus Gracilibacteria bacterium]|jgi:zinc transport system ATP-binding protein|nr:metal ABC transporter ATP-binding protein [Candidatus Gracilibacteria bacterium]
MNNVLEVKNLSVKYGNTVALEKVSFEIEKGDFIGLVGPNGAGKSTLIKAILGLTEISTGRISLFSKDISKFKEFSKIGYLPQKSTKLNSLFPVSVFEVISLGILSKKKFPKRLKKEDDEKVHKILEDLKISKLSKKCFFELSGGEQQKVLLGRAIVSDPEILIFDEPSTALDPASREEFFTLVKKLNDEQKTTVILITHDTGYVGKYANKLIYIDRKLEYFGKIGDFCKGEDFDSCFEKSDHHIIWHQHN